MPTGYIVSGRHLSNGGRIFADFLCYVGLHGWRIVEDTGMTRYVECRRCGKRDAYQRATGGHQPIDPLWIAEGRFTDWSKVDVSGIRSAARPPTTRVEVCRRDDDGSV